MAMPASQVPSRPVGRWPHISHSGAWMLGQCERRWAFRYRDQLPAEPSRSMAKGLFLHRCLAAWWTGDDWREEALAQVREWREAYQTIDEVSGEITGLAEPDWMHDMVWLLDRYDAFYDRAGVEVLATEEPFRVRLPGKYAWLEGRIDLIFRQLDTDRIWICDWKSTSKFDGFEEYCWAPQLSLYYYAAQELGYEPDGIMIDGLNTYRWVKPRPLEDSFQRRWLDRSLAQMEMALADATGALVRARELLKGAYPLRNVDRHCQWCEYREPCREEMAFGPGYVELEE